MTIDAVEPVGGNVRRRPRAGGPATAKPRTMTYHFVQIKLRILRNAFTGDKRLRYGMIVMVIASLAGAVFTFLRIWNERRFDAINAADHLVLQFNLIFAAWVFGPLLSGGVDDTLDPSRVTLFPLHPSELRRGFVAAALTGYVPLATFIGVSGAVFAFSGSVSDVIVLVACVFTLIGVSLAASRALAVVLALSGRSRRGRDIGIIAASSFGGLLFLGGMSTTVMSDSQYDRAIDIARWFPAGFIGQAVIDVREGLHGQAGLRVLAMAALAWALLQVWMRGLDKLLVLPESVRHERRVGKLRYPIMGSTVRLLGRRPWAVVAMKELRYLFRAPQRRSAFVIGTVIGAPFAFVQMLRTGSTDGLAIWFAPVSLLFGLGATNNLLGADASSLWIETSSGLPMRTLLMGKSIAAVPYLVTPVIVSSVALGVFADDPSSTLLMIALALVCWGIPLGTGCLVSVLTPFAQHDQDNPYANRRPTSGEGCLIGLLGVGSMAAIGVCILPVAILMGVVVRFGQGWMIPVGVACSGLWSAFIWFTGLTVASRIAQKSEADLVTNMGARKR
jgi:ABC-2 type transport system permease protein